MDISYAGGNLQEIAWAAARITPPKQSHRLAFLALARASRARDIQQENSGPMDYTGPSNES
jgi:hypothetical protein